MPSPSEISRELQSIEAAIEEGELMAARESLSSFCEYVMVDNQGRRWKTASHQQEWFNILSDHSIKRILIVAPRNSAKSTSIQAFVLREIGLNPNIVVKYVCGNEGKAIERVMFLRKNITESERYKKVFPHIEPEGVNTEWSKHKAFVRRSAGLGIQDATIEAASVLSGGTGGRCDLLILDDIIDSAKAITKPSLMAQVKMHVEDDWMKTLNPGGRVVMIGTYWSFDPPDIYVEYTDRTEIWKVWSKPACQLDINDQVTGPYLWPERWGQEELEAARGDGEESFQQQYLLKGATIRSSLFSPEHISKAKTTDFSLGEIPEGTDFVRIGIGLDPATSLTTKTGSYGCVFVSGQDVYGQKIPLAILRLKADPEILCSSVIDQYQQWSQAIGCPVSVLVENSSTQKAFETLVRIIGERRGLDSIPLKGQFTGNNKFSPEAGLPARNAELAQGKWLIPFGGDHTVAFHDCPVCQWVNEMLYWGKLRDGKGRKVTSDIIMGWWLSGCALDQYKSFGDVPIYGSRSSLNIQYGTRRIA